ncbi:MAG: glycosyltransferase family 2 protein [Chloroflexota bacterium]|nr:glycosyltransferase family 2 protein [Chloroflexota bacterium]MDE2947362.1 glycosyltransferase family 2 protein [Chloroflexota bacterium]
MPLVSVVMPVYNGERYLAEAIDSILAQTFTDFELIIVDDGSRDGSAEIICEYMKRDERVRPLRHEVNRGRADARNTGIAAATGKLMAMMDCDDVSLPERLEEQLRFLGANPDIGGVGAGCRLVDHELRPLRDYHLPQQHALIAFNQFFDLGFMGGTMMFRREILNAASGFQTGRRLTDDTELQWRLLEAKSSKLAVLPNMLLLHRQHHQPKLRNSDLRKKLLETRRGMLRGILENLWGEAPPEDTIERFWRLRPHRKLSWRERRLAKRDIIRLIDAMISHNWIDPGDKPLLIAEMHRLLERSSPRLWQQFCHWRRHKFGR